MSLNFLEMATKCPKCGRFYLRIREQKKCPHNFRDKRSRQLAGQQVPEKEG